MTSLHKDSSLLEVAAAVSAALEKAGITATLSGGGAVSIYTSNQYQSEDLDFVTSAMIAELKPVLESLGFRHSGTPRLAQFEHPDIAWYLEFPPSPLSFGHLQIEHGEAAIIDTPVGKLRIISPTHSVMDRLAAALAWNDEQARQQAIMLAACNDIDWPALEQWFIDEGETTETFERFKAAVNRFRKYAPE